MTKPRRLDMFRQEVREGCRFAHDDPERLPHRCSEACDWTLAEALEHMETQPIRLPSVPRSRGVDGKPVYGVDPTEMTPARTFVPWRR